MVHVKWKKSVQ